MAGVPVSGGTCGAVSGGSVKVSKSSVEQPRGS